MATMLMMKQMTNTMVRFNKLAIVSKAQLFPHQLKLHSCSLSYPTHYISRVSFTSASRIYQVFPYFVSLIPNSFEIGLSTCSSTNEGKVFVSRK